MFGFQKGTYLWFISLMGKSKVLYIPGESTHKKFFQNYFSSMGKLFIDLPQNKIS